MHISDIPTDFIYNNMTAGQAEYMVIRYRISQMLAEKKTVNEIADEINLSASRVYKIIEKLR